MCIRDSVKTLDPSCGSGIFLVESFKRLVKRYENAHSTVSYTHLDVYKRQGHSDYKAMKPYIDIADEIKATAMEKFDSF